MDTDVDVDEDVASIIVAVAEGLVGTRNCELEASSVETTNISVVVLAVEIDRTSV